MKDGPLPIASERRQSLRLTLQGIEAVVNVRVRRRPKSHGTIICAPGLTASGAEFHALGGHLSALGYDVICPDWPGHGDSPYAPDAKIYSWDSYVKMLRIVYRAQGGANVHFLGVSWGAIILLLMLLVNPIRPRSAVFVDLPLSNRPEIARAYEGMAKLCETRFDSIEEAESYLRERRPDLVSVPPSMRSYYRDARFARRDGKIVYKCDPRVVSAAAAQSDRPFDFLDYIRHIAFEALFLYGANSPFRDPATFSALCREMRNIEYIDTLEGGHPPGLLTDEQIRPVASFFARQVPADWHGRDGGMAAERR